MTDVAGDVIAVSAAAGAGGVSTNLQAGSTIAVTTVAPTGGVDAYSIVRTDDKITLTLNATTVHSQPGVLPASVALGTANTVAYFFFDGSTSPFHSETLDEYGAATSVNLPINNRSVGSHTVTVSHNVAGNAPNDTETFTVASTVVVDPEDTPTLPPDPPVPGPAVLYWTFRDYVDDSEVYTFPTNPTTLRTPATETSFSTARTTSPAGKTVLWEGQASPPVYSWDGFARTQAHVAALRYWAGKKQRIYVTDQFGRRYTVKVSRLRLTRVRNPENPWLHRYEMSAHVFKIEPAGV